MGIIQTIKNFFSKPEVEQPQEQVQEEPVVEETQEADLGSPTGEFCNYDKCKKEIYSNEPVRVLKDFKFHKRCAKKVIKDAKRQMGLIS